MKYNKRNPNIEIRTQTKFNEVTRGLKFTLANLVTKAYTSAQLGRQGGIISWSKKSHLLLTNIPFSLLADISGNPWQVGSGR